ncbi:YfhH family protein [Bacillus altitudinis S70-5-12]|uniref:YfhH family protein n=1 Tax=Bacillus altitudinis TaxID=293387 RepID=UPI001BAA3682|nr:YfhH family protein [Bacillus altitudinis]MBR0629170.1 YfhH family protein [Bacillus altitudinis S70-5-12]
MEKRYSEMTEYELKQEIAALSEKARKAEQLGIVNEYAVLERKIDMAKAYLLDPAAIQTKTTYHIKDTDEQFYVEYLNGVFAWGYRVSEPNKEDALPISMLTQKD